MKIPMAVRRATRAAALVSTGSVPAGSVLAGIAAVWAGNLFGLWWVALPVGAILGVLVRGTWRALAAAAAAGALGWALPLAWLAGYEPVGHAADVVAGIIGFGTAGGVIIVLTVLLGALLGAAGAWVVVALRGLPVREHAAPAPSSGMPVVESAAPTPRPVQAPAGAARRRRRTGKRR